MKTKKYFFMAALAILMTACSSDDNELTQQPAKAEGIPFTATISIGESASTRALAENGSGGLTATWAENDEVALIHNGVIDKVTVASVSGGVATISGTITGSPTTGDAVTVIYPYDAADGTTENVKAGLLAAQDGTLATIAANYDVRKGTGTLKVSGTASLNGNVSLTNLFAIMKLTLANDAKNLCIMADDITIAGATLASEGKVFTVAVPAVSSKTVTIVANDESNNYYYFSKGGVTIYAGKYYQSAPTMTAIGTSSSADKYMITGNVSTQTIEAGKTVVLYNVTISNGQIACSGNANIILMGANTVTATTDKAAIKIGGSGTTLTITGSGSLTATGGMYGAGIGTDHNGSGGNIVINGGTVTANGGNYGAGIGTGRAQGASITCGDITINGGTVTATGGNNGAGIGTGVSESSSSNTCGAITIGTGVTMVTATKGNRALNSIGKGRANSGTQTCGTITIGGDATTYATGVTANTFTYPAP